MILSLKGLGAAAAHFNDVPETHQFYRYVQRVYDAGITSGCQNDPPMFCPDDTVTRGQLAVFLSRMLDAQAGNVGAPLPAVPDGGGMSIAGFKISPLQALGGLLIVVALLRR